MDLTCTKRFGPYPFAHRQWTHTGHCQFIHGHNWHFEIEFECTHRDDNGFVVDFGSFGPLKEQFKESFDHTLVLRTDDPIFNDSLFTTILKSFAKLIRITDASSEGVAGVVANMTQQFLDRVSNERHVSVLRVRVFEDEHNSATWTNE